MPVRAPAVAGRFYPGEPSVLTRTLEQAFAPCGAAEKDTPLALMLPHAGYVFSAGVAARTLAGVSLPQTLVILCPNHTGLGSTAFGVWTKGSWRTPLGEVAVDEDLAARLCGEPPFAPDTASHLREHSIEVILPFLQFLRPGNPPEIVPVCIGTQNPAALALAGRALGKVCAGPLQEGRVGLLVSSDMNHMEDEETTRKKDARALDRVLAEDPAGLLDRCRKERITMCGAGPMALVLHALAFVRGAAKTPPKLMARDTSGSAFGDFSRVVGYAGVRFYA